MYRIADLISHLEQTTPPALQEEYDNCGLLVGNGDTICSGVLLTLDVTEDVVQEAIQKNCNLIVAHHPVIFKGLKKLNGTSWTERIIITCIQQHIAVYAIHTNLDNLYEGVNHMLASRLGLKNPQILSPRRNLLSKLITFIPVPDTAAVLDAVFNAGAGHTGEYSGCSFTVTGTGSFTPGAAANPHIGKAGKPETVQENRVEVLYPSYLEGRIVKALKEAHPYEEPAFDLIRLENTMDRAGSGMIGELETPMPSIDFLRYLKQSLNLELIRYTHGYQGAIRKVAVCGGSGSFLLKRAIQQGAQALVTADFKYHDFFDAEKSIQVCDIGHYESEIHTKELLKSFLTKKFTNIAIVLSDINTNPVRYFTL